MNPSTSLTSRLKPNVILTLLQKQVILIQFFDKKTQNDRHKKRPLHQFGHDNLNPSF
jgi:hypothetical protein